MRALACTRGCIVMITGQCMRAHNRRDLLQGGEGLQRCSRLNRGSLFVQLRIISCTNKAKYSFTLRLLFHYPRHPGSTRMSFAIYMAKSTHGHSCAVYKAAIAHQPRNSRCGGMCRATTLRHPVRHPSSSRCRKRYGADPPSIFVSVYHHFIFITISSAFVSGCILAVRSSPF